MNANRKDLICRAIFQTLRRSSGISDPVGLSERIADNIEFAIDLDTQPDGIAEIPADMRDAAFLRDHKSSDGPDEVEKIQLAPPPRNAIVPASPKAKSMIVMPGDREFKEAGDRRINPTEVAKRPLITAPTQLSRPRRQASNSPEVQHWDYAELSDAVNKNTPDSITFDIDGPEGRPVKIRVEKNVMTQQGMGTVILSYKHPQVSASVSGNVTVDLIAKVPFSLYTKEIDLQDAMEGPKGIMAQLQGMYRYRESMPAPRTVDPGPLRIDMKNQPGEDYKSDFTPGESPVDPYGKVLEGVRRANDSAAPAGKRFNT